MTGCVFHEMLRWKCNVVSSARECNKKRVLSVVNIISMTRQLKPRSVCKPKAWERVNKNAFKSLLSARSEQRRCTKVSAGIHTHTKARLLQTSFDQYRFVSSFFDVFHEQVWFPDGALYSHRCSNRGLAFVNLRGEAGEKEREKVSRRIKIGKYKINIK